MTTRENVEVALNLGGVRGQRAHERAEQLLVALGLAERLDFDIDQLSGGEKQRVAIARAIANRPQLIFADEPTANLDSAHGAETMRLLRSSRRTRERPSRSSATTSGYARSPTACSGSRTGS